MPHVSAEYQGQKVKHLIASNEPQEDRIKICGFSTDVWIITEILIPFYALKPIPKSKYGYF